MNRKTILYVHHGKGLGGAPLSLLYLIQGLDKTKFRPIVVFLHDSDALKLYREKGIEVIGPVKRFDFSHTAIYWFKWYHLHHAARSLWDSLITRWILAPRLLREIKPNLVHLNTSSLTAWGMAAYKAGIPVIWHIREPLADGYCGLRKKIVTNIIARCATKIIPICQADGLPWQESKKLKIIYNAVNPAQFAREQAKEKTPHTPTILFLGGLSEQKGTLFLLQIFAQVLSRLPSTKLIIAGYFKVEDPNTFFARKWTSSWRHDHAARQLYQILKSNIELTGPTTNVPALMARSDVLVFPASVDHFARPIIEAGFMGLPSIASDLPHLRELVQNNSTGYLLPFGNHQLWVKKILTVLETPRWQKQLGNNAFNFCSSHFGLAEQIQNIEQIYSQ